MANFTNYLTVLEDAPGRFTVRIESGSPLPLIQASLAKSKDLRYSPILPAYLLPGEEPQIPPQRPESIGFFFARQPYQSLGKIKPGLSEDERHLVFFTEGFASIVGINFKEETALKLKDEMKCSQMEFWDIGTGSLSRENILLFHDVLEASEVLSTDFAPTGDPALDVYIEQILASVTTLWAYYGVHFPEERDTLKRILQLLGRLLELRSNLAATDSSIATLRQQNAIISALVELSASLSYSVTQGTSGASPIMDNRSPFPHHSLLGVAGAIRALTKFTRYLENAFQTRSAAEVIAKQYSTKAAVVPAKISTYESGMTYSFAIPDGAEEEFDTGGDFKTTSDIPLLAHYSLRHGFKEAKFSVTAASESLTAECVPAWTLMTLSHEIMHSRVRHIFQSLFGISWLGDDGEVHWDSIYREYSDWYKSRDNPPSIPLRQGIRNAVLYFCCSVEREIAVPERRAPTGREINRNDLLTYFLRHKRLASELFVHFHDYYFAYARQPKLYVMSLWASWTTVAAPVARPQEYLVRTLATIACGTGSPPLAAFDGAVDILEEGLASLEAAGIESPLFDELKSLVKNSNREQTYALFKPAYYLIDQVRKNFASRIIANEIDRLDSDPFAEGSTVADEYSSSIYVHGDDQSGILISPIRYSLAALVRQLSGRQSDVDFQWLTAWNMMVISSQEVRK